MTIDILLAYTAIAAISVVSPGPAVVLALRNGVAHGLRAVVWSSLGNITGLFLVSSAAMLGLGALIMSSTQLFTAVKILGACYLFYLGLKHLLGKASVMPASSSSKEPPNLSALTLYREAILLAITNPKPVLFFTALFPQFLDTRAPLLPQFFLLTGIFMTLSFVTLMLYGHFASHARKFIARPAFLRWVNRCVGATFIAFGAMLLAIRRPVN